MTFEEAKKILEKEGFYFEKATRPCAISEAFTEYEDPSICKAMQVVSSAGYFVCMEMSCFDERKARLKKEHEKHANAPVSGKEKAKKGNPALEEAASQFNDALLDEQGKKIKHLTKKISRLNKIIHKKNEELRLTKIREKNLAELGLKYVGENEKLKKKLADKSVDKIDAQALKSAESALAYKEKVIAEKDDVIADLGKELAAQKDLVDDISLKYDGAKHNLNLRMKECEKLKEKLEEANSRIKAIRNASKGYCEYGIAAEKMIRKMANIIVYEEKISSKDFEEYRRWANGYRFNPQLSDFIEEEEKKLNAAKMLDFNAKCMKAARESINDVFESYAAKYAKSSLDDLKEKAYESFNAKAYNLGLVGSKDGNGLLNQMEWCDVAEEGADQSGKIVICGKDFGKLLKENEESEEELSKVLNDVIDQFLLFGEIIIKSEK